MDAEEIFAYFKGTGKDRPACLKDSVQVTMDRVYQKHTSFLRASFSKPVKGYQKSIWRNSCTAGDTPRIWIP